jgi:hypothetical protein
MTAALATSLPFGLRDVKIYPFLDVQGTILANEGFDLDNAQTFSFADTEDFVDLRGDDELKASHGNGAQVNWTLEAGGVSLQIWAIFTGGQIIETGVAPNRVITLRKCSDDARPYFQVRGLSVSENGGDMEGVVYRAKCTGDIAGQFADGAFFITSADGQGLSIPGTRLLYDFIQHETRTFLSIESKPLPILPPKNVVASPTSATTATVVWEPISGVVGYRLETSDDAGVSWDVVATEPTTALASLTTLVADTDYLVRVASKVGTDYSNYGKPVAFSTPAA